MARQSKVVSFSLSQDVLEQLNQLTSVSGLNRSQLLRSLLGTYQSLSKDSTDDKEKASDLASLLRSYWDIKAQSPLQIIVTGLGVVSNDQGQVLIVSRDPDQVVENLTWSFPGGRITSLDFDEQIKRLIFARTGVKVEVRNLIHTRIFPDSSFENVQINVLYFDCLAIGESKIIEDKHYQKLQWVEPMDVFKYFTSSTSDEVTKFLSMLQRSQES